MPDQAYAVAGENVVHEVIDGEAILINMITGTYYSLDGIACAIWTRLQNGAASADRLHAELSEQGCALPADAPTDLAAFLAALEAAGLVIKTDTSITASASAATAEATPYAKPVLHTYTDMEALLQIDPIHDVSPQGWPNQEGGSASR